MFTPFLIIPNRRGVPEILGQKLFHVGWIRRFKRRYQDRTKEGLHVEMTCASKDPNWFASVRSGKLDNVTRGTVNSNRRKSAEMFHLLFAAEPDWPPKFGIGNQSQMSQISGGEQVRIGFDKCAQDSFRKDFGAHRAMQKKIEIVLRPRGDLR